MDTLSWREIEQKVQGMNDVQLAEFVEGLDKDMRKWVIENLTEVRDRMRRIQITRALEGVKTPK